MNNQSAMTPDIVEIECFDPLPAIVLSHKIYGRGSNERLIAKAVELEQINPVTDNRRMPTKIRAYTSDMLPEVLAARRI